MNEYHVRIDTTKEHPVIQDIVKGSSSWLICQEGDGDKIDYHCHIYVLTKLSDTAMRERIKKHGFSGNKSYSTARCRDKLKLISYIIKDGHYEFNNIDNSVIEDAIAYGSKVKQEMLTKKKASGYEAVAQYLDQQDIDFSNGYSMVACNVASKVIQYMSQSGLQVRRFHVVSYTDTYLAKKMEHYNMFLASQIMFRLS